MQIYTFYSDYNDQYDYKNIPREVIDSCSYEDKPIPEKYRSKELDVFITGMNELLPDEWKHFKSLQIWYSKHNKEWKYDFWWSNDPERIKLVKEKYQNSFKEVSKLPSFVPHDIFRYLILIAFTEYYDDKKELFDKFGFHFNSKHWDSND